MNISLPTLLAVAVALVRPAPCQGTPEAEPNDSLALATPLVDGMQSFGSVAPAGDVDAYTFTLSTFADVFAWTAPGFAGPIGDTRLALTDAIGGVLAENDDGGPGFGWYSKVRCRRLPPGTYFLLVSGFDQSTVGSYTLDVQVLPIGAPAAAFEGPELNDPRLAGGVATAVAAGSRSVGGLGAPGGGTASYTHPTADYDFYAFTVATPGPYTIATLATAYLPSQPPRCTDTVVFLVAANNLAQVLAANDDADGGLWSSMSVPIATPGVYCAVVTAFAASIGSYALDITGPDATPIAVHATYTMHPGGCAGSFGVPQLGVRATAPGSVDEPERPLLGTTFYVDLTGIAPSAAVFRCAGLSELVPPFDLTPLGAPGCQFEVLIYSSRLVLADPAGADFWQTNVPPFPWLLGMPLQQQALILDLGANALGVSVSNRVSWTVGLEH